MEAELTVEHEAAADVGLPQPPTEYDAFAGACLQTGDATIALPQPFAYVHGTVEISGTAKGDNFAFFRVQAGAGGGGQERPQRRAVYL